MSRKKSPSSEPVRTWGALAAAVGRNRKTLSRLRERPDWPKGVPRRTVPRGGFSAEQIAALAGWLGGLQENRAATAEADGNGEGATLQMELLRQRLERGRMEIEAEQQRIARDRGDHFTRDEVDRVAGGLVAEFVTLLNEIELTWPGRFARKAADDLRPAMAELLDTYRARLVGRAEVDLAHLEETRRAAEKKRGRGRPGRKS